MVGLLSACEPCRRGGRPRAGGELAALRQECERLRGECARQQALVRAAQRTVGLAPPAPAAATPPPSTGSSNRKRRKRRPRGAGLENGGDAARGRRYGVGGRNRECSGNAATGGSRNDRLSKIFRSVSPKRSSPRRRARALLFLHPAHQEDERHGRESSMGWSGPGPGRLDRCQTTAYPDSGDVGGPADGGAKPLDCWAWVLGVFMSCGGNFCGTAWTAWSRGCRAVAPGSRRQGSKRLRPSRRNCSGCGLSSRPLKSVRRSPWPCRTCSNGAGPRKNPRGERIVGPSLRPPPRAHPGHRPGRRTADRHRASAQCAPASRPASAWSGGSGSGAAGFPALGCPSRTRQHRSRRLAGSVRPHIAKLGDSLAAGPVGPRMVGGRPAPRSDRATRQRLLALIELVGPHIGVPTLQTLFRSMPRREIADMLRRYRRIWRRRGRRLLRILHWRRAGTVWAIDFAEPPLAVEGKFDRLLAVSRPGQRPAIALAAGRRRDGANRNCRAGVAIPGTQAAAGAQVGQRHAAHCRRAVPFPGAMAGLAPPVAAGMSRIQRRVRSRHRLDEDPDPP